MRGFAVGILYAITNHSKHTWARIAICEQATPSGLKPAFLQRAILTQGGKPECYTTMTLRVLTTENKCTSWMQLSSQSSIRKGMLQSLCYTVLYSLACLWSCSLLSTSHITLQLDRRIALKILAAKTIKLELLQGIVAPLVHHLYPLDITPHCSS